MTIIKKITRNLIVAVLTLATLSPSLTAMNEQPAAGVGIGQFCQHLADTLDPRLGHVQSNVAAHIYFFCSISPLVDEIVQNCTEPETLLAAITMIRRECGPALSGEILKVALKQTGKSVCDIKNNVDFSVLYVAALHYKGIDEIQIVLATLTNEQVWKLVRMPDMFGWTALHAAVFNNKIELIKHILAVLTEAQAWKLICKPGDNGQTSFDVASEEIQLIMEEYRQVGDNADVIDEDDNDKKNDKPDNCVIQ